MTSGGLPIRTWLAPCAVVGLLFVALPQRSIAAEEPRVWLEKMNRALATRNYDGTFFHLSGGRVETMRIVHRVRAGRVTERLVSLDGSGREFVRNNDELTCYLPDQHTVLVEPRQDRGPFFRLAAAIRDRGQRVLPLRIVGEFARSGASRARHHGQPEGSVPVRVPDLAG